MKNRWLLNIILLIAITALAILVSLKPGKDKDNDVLPITTLDEKSINKIRLTRNHKPDIELIKKDANWQMTKPIKARANRFNINSLLRIASIKPDTRFTAGDDVAKYGLGPAKASLYLNDVLIEIGGKHALRNARYVRHGDSIALVPGYLLRMTENTYTDFINAGLLESGRTLTGIKTPMLTLKQDQGNWVITPKPEKEISADRINDFVQEWQHAHALSVDKYSGQAVQDRISLNFTDSKDTGLNLGILSYSPEFILYRKDEGLEYRFTEDTGKRLLSITTE